MVKNNQDSDLNDNKLTKLDSIKVSRDPASDDELANKKYVDDLIADGTILSFNQTLEIYLKVSVGTDKYNPCKYDKIQITDLTENKRPNSGSDVLQKWKIINNKKDREGKIGKFLKTTETISPNGDSGATSLPRFGNSFMYIETSSSNHGDSVFLSWERTDIIQNSNITFYYNGFSILTDGSLKAMGCYIIQVLLEDNTWVTRYNIPKNGRCSDISTDWTKISLNFTEENYGIKLIYDQIDTADADMCFCNISITHSAY